MFLMTVLLLSGRGECTRAAQAPELPPLGAAYYAVEMGGKLLGYATVEPAGTQTWNGKPVDVVKALTQLKVKMLGQEKNLRFESETFLAQGTTTPVFYRVLITQGERTQQVECELTEKQARTWAFKPGAERGQPTATELEPGTFLADGNNFAHLVLLARALPNLDAPQKGFFFAPSGPAVEERQLDPAEPQEVEAPGGKRTCAVLVSSKDGLKLFLEAATRELVRLEVPGQELVVRLDTESIVKLSEKAAAEEVLEQHFCSSNVTFDSFLDVTYVKAEIDVKVFGAAVENDPAVLTTPMQTFTGKKEKDHLTGLVEIRTRPYDGRNAPPFPAAEAAKELAPWLKAEPLIEADDQAIVQQAQEITRGAQDSWEAAKRIAEWVHQNLHYEIADSPSARLALETKRGDCGPHSTLTVALLRAVGIPAKLVGGLCYSPSFGGSWGQHAWVEVHLGEAGWVPLEPTTGECEQMNAGHIKLFEGLGAVRPTAVKVLDYEPKTLTQPAALSEVKPLPWPLDKPVRYRYRQGNQPLGTETVTIKRVPQEGPAAYQMDSVVDLKVGQVVVKGHTTLTVAENMRPLAFKAQVNQAGTEYQIDATFHPGRVTERVQKANLDLTKDLDLPENTYCFDNNLLGSWTLLCTQLPYEVGKKIDLLLFHPSSMQKMPLTFQVKGLSPVTVGGKEEECFECFVEQLKNTFWITRDGRFVKGQQGPLVFELEGEEK